MVKKCHKSGVNFWGVICLVWVLSIVPAYGQEYDTPGILKVESDPKLDLMIAQRKDLFKADSSSHGFRIQILTKSNRKEAMLEFENFQLNYPELPIYLKYDSPNFKLRVGDFEDKIEAYYWFTRLQESYPLLFVVPDKVNPKQFREDL